MVPGVQVDPLGLIKYMNITPHLTSNKVFFKIRNSAAIGNNVIRTGTIELKSTFLIFTYFIKSLVKLLVIYVH